MNIQTMKKCIVAFKQIETVHDLKRAKITQEEHFEIGYTISDAVRAHNERRGYKGETISESVRNWFVKHGATATPRGIGWQIEFL